MSSSRSVCPCWRSNSSKFQIINVHLHKLSFRKQGTKSETKEEKKLFGRLFLSDFFLLLFLVSPSHSRHTFLDCVVLSVIRQQHHDHRCLLPPSPVVHRCSTQQTTKATTTMPNGFCFTKKLKILMPTVFSGSARIRNERARNVMKYILLSNSFFRFLSASTGRYYVYL